LARVARAGFAVAIRALADFAAAGGFALRSVGYGAADVSPACRLSRGRATTRATIANVAATSDAIAVGAMAIDAATSCTSCVRGLGIAGYRERTNGYERCDEQREERKAFHDKLLLNMVMD
jgi:hypothetical protein